MHLLNWMTIQNKIVPVIENNKTSDSWVHNDFTDAYVYNENNIILAVILILLISFRVFFVLLSFSQISLIFTIFKRVLVRILNVITMMMLLFLMISITFYCRWGSKIEQMQSFFDVFQIIFISTFSKSNLVGQHNLTDLEALFIVTMLILFQLFMVLYSFAVLKDAAHILKKTEDQVSTNNDSVIHYLFPVNLYYIYKYYQSIKIKYLYVEQQLSEDKIPDGVERKKIILENREIYLID